MRWTYLLIWCAMMGTPGTVLGQEPIPAPGTNKQLDAFRAYLKKNYPNKKWQYGPKQLTSAAIQKAYPDRQFYYIFSAPPLPPAG